MTTNKIKLHKLHNEVVVPMKIASAQDKRPPRGKALIPEAYANIYACAKKNSGKTCTITHLIRQCCGPETEIYVFCSTVFIDDTWIEMAKWAKRKGVAFFPNTSLKEDKHDLINDLIDDDQHFIQDADDAQNPVADPSKRILDLSEGSSKPRKKKPSKYKELRKIIVFDDISQEIRHSAGLKRLLKLNRHMRCKVIVSSQYPMDLDFQSWNQLDYVLLFKSHSIEKLEQIYERLDLGISFDMFVFLYKSCTQDKTKYNFLWIDRFDKFRLCFNYEYILPE